MGKARCCDKEGVKRGAWSPEEDAKLIQHIKEHGHGNWRNLPNQAGLLRCGKSCRLCWINYLRPDIKRGSFAPEEEATIIQLHGLFGNKWAAIASHPPGRTDNEIKNFWNTRPKKCLLSMGHKDQTHQSLSEPSIIKPDSASTRHMVQWESVRVEAEARLSMESSPLDSSLEDKNGSDIFLRLWNSQVGESFRESTRKGGLCGNAISQTSQTALESYLSFTVQARPACTSISAYTTHEQDCYRPNVDVMPGSDSNSDEFTDSSDTALKLLLDFPGGDDMGFLCEKTERF